MSDLPTTNKVKLEPHFMRLTRKTLYTLKPYAKPNANHSSW
ncbi:hypothetical protein [Rubritalea tangerina]